MAPPQLGELQYSALSHKSAKTVAQTSTRNVRFPLVGSMPADFLKEKFTSSKCGGRTASRPDQMLKVAARFPLTPTTHHLPQARESDAAAAAEAEAEAAAGAAAKLAPHATTQVKDNRHSASASLRR
jgi:hypothetical protein